MDNEPVDKQIDNIIKKHGGWKADILTKLRATILQTDPKITEEIKWRMATRPEGLAVWEYDGILCFVEIWKDNVKLIFSKGSKLKDTNKLFNSRLNSSLVRAIEYHEGDTVDVGSLTSLVLEAIEVNKSK